MDLFQGEGAINYVEAFYVEVTKQWLDHKLQRNIGYVQYAPAIAGADSTGYTFDWGVFVAYHTKASPNSRATSSTLVAYFFCCCVFRVWLTLA